MCKFCISIIPLAKVKVRRVAANIQRCRWVLNWEKPSSVECTLLLELTPTTQALCALRVICARGSLLPTEPRKLPWQSIPDGITAEVNNTIFALCLWSRFTFIAVGGFFFRMTRWTMNENCGLLFQLITQAHLFFYAYEKFNCSVYILFHCIQVKKLKVGQQ